MKSRQRYWSTGRVVLAGGVALLAISGWLRFQQAVELWGWLNWLGAVPRPAYIAASGLVIGMVATVIFISALARYRLADLFQGGFIYGYTLWYWTERLLLSPPGSNRTNLPFAAGATLLGLAFTAGVVVYHQKNKWDQFTS
jgi:hypothetical protein